MNLLGDFHFIRPAWLLLTPVVVWLWWWVRSAQDPIRAWRAVMDGRLLNAMLVGKHAGRRWRGSTLLAAWLIAVVALAGPTWKPEPSPFADDPVPVMLVLKADESMELADFSPSRMERARLKIKDFASRRGGQPLGLIAYAGSAHLVLPPTRDTSVVASMASEVSPAIMPKPGDNLVEALNLAAKTLGDVGGSVVIVTDNASSVNEAALKEFRRESLLVVSFLAVARDGTPELDSISDAAATLGANVTRIAADSQDIDSLVRATARAPVRVAADGSGTRWAESGWWLVPLLALLSLADFRRVDPIASAEGNR
ncbi:VWA domain-containing protein [Planctomycetaceae bacterium SH139]